MALKKEKELKLYYSIKEVAEMLGTTEPTLRFWEKEFPQIAPKKGTNRVRQYSKSDIQQIRIIHHLLKERGMTLKGVKQQIKEKHGKLERNVDVIERLKAVRVELLEIREALDSL